MRVCGIDEAGRGPVIGPIVMAGIIGDEEEFKKLGVKDSKLLKPSEREELYEKLVKYEHFVIIVGPEEIDAAISSPDNMNLNWLEASTTAKTVEPKIILNPPGK